MKLNKVVPAKSVTERTDLAPKLLNFDYGVIHVQLEKQKNVDDKFEFFIEKAQSIDFKLTTEDKASNIFITKIIFPDGKIIVPVSKTYAVDILQKGMYSIEIGYNSKIQEAAYNGKYNLEIILR